MNPRALASLSLLLVSATSARSGEWFVTSERDAADQRIDGSCRTAFDECSLRAALEESAASPEADLVHLPPGTFRSDGAGLGSFAFPLGLTLLGAGRDLTRLAHGPLQSLVFDRPGLVRIEGLALDPLVVDGSELELRRVRLDAGAELTNLLVLSGRAELRESELVGASFPYVDSELNWTGFDLRGGELLLERCLVGGVDVDHPGSGGDTTSVRLRTFRLGGGRLEVRNSTVLGNRVTGGVDYGEALAEGLSVDPRSELLLDHVTLEGSSTQVTWDRFGVHVGRAATFAGGPLGPGARIEGCVILASHRALDELVPVCLGEAVLVGPSWFEAIEPTCNAGSEPSLVLGPGDPALEDLADNGGPTLSRHPAGDSPVLDAGAAASCPSEDQRGAPRPVGPGCDLGAVEGSCYGRGRDLDADGACEDDDTCPGSSDPLQVDTDGDGAGDACDEDDDDDGVLDEDDLCPLVSDPGQEDADGDGRGDACDGCPEDVNPSPEDADGDGIEDACDSCPLDPDPAASDADGDGTADACDCAPGDAGNSAARPGPVRDLRLGREPPGPGFRLFWSDPLAPFGGLSSAYDVAEGPLPVTGLDADCLVADWPDAELSPAVDGDRWFVVRAATRCAGSFGHPFVDASPPCP